MSWLLGLAKNALGGIWGYLAAAGAVLLAVLAIYNKGKSSGINEVVVKTKEKEVENVKKAAKVEREIAATPADERRARLRKSWTRK